MPKIDVSDELNEHYELIKGAAKAAVEDPDESASSKASMLNATTSILKELAKIQTELFSSSLISQLQYAIVEALEEHDQEFKDKVIEILERRLMT